MNRTNRNQSILFAGGGSGGHLFPGLAVAEELQFQLSDLSFLFVGTNRAIEQRIHSLAKPLFSVPCQHIPLELVSYSSLLKRPLHFWKTFTRLRREVRTLIANHQPKLIVGLGGISSIPVVLEGKRVGTPIVLLEQNVLPGRSNRFLAKFADCVCLSFKESKQYFSSKIHLEVTGNPLRRSILELFSLRNRNQSSARCDSPTLLILGGSQGAKGINRLVDQSLPLVQGSLSGWQVIHQTGSPENDHRKQFLSSLSFHYEAISFLDDIRSGYQNASLIITRAGATTLAECAILGIPAILIPDPASVKNHQTQNAKYYQKHSAAVLISEVSHPNRRSLIEMVKAIRTLVSDSHLRSTMSDRMRELAQPDATSKVSEIVLERMR